MAMRTVSIILGVLCVWLATSEASVEWKLQWGSPIKAELVRFMPQAKFMGLGPVMFWNVFNTANETFGTQVIMMNHEASPFPQLRKELKPGASDVQLLIGNPPLHSSFLVAEWCYQGLVVGDPLNGNCSRGMPIYGYVDDVVQEYRMSREEFDELEADGLIKSLSVGANADNADNAESLGSYIGRIIVMMGMAGCFAGVLYFYTIKGTFILPPTASARAFHNQVYAEIVRKKK